MIVLTSSLLAFPEKTLRREMRSEKETGKEKDRWRGAMLEDIRYELMMNGRVTDEGVVEAGKA